MTAPVSVADAPPASPGFSTEWLALREPLDLEARPVALVRRLAACLPKGDFLTVMDLGCGTGSNLRALAPQLNARQTWQLIDHDPVLLGELTHRTRPWAESRRLVQRWENDDATVLALDDDTDTFRYRLVLEARDLAATLDSLECGGRDLVTAAALMDLVSHDWLQTLVTRIVAARAAAYFSLTYTGMIRWTPADAMDDEILALFNRHQRQDKGFGPALGPDAPQTMVDMFKAAGYHVTTEPSDWDASPEARGFQRTLAKDIAAAALEVASPDRQRQVRQWLDRRLQAIEDGHGCVRVGHVDLLAHP
jgi:SAM-dependent methyltransferase